MQADLASSMPVQDTGLPVPCGGTVAGAMAMLLPTQALLRQFELPTVSDSVHQNPVAPESGADSRAGLIDADDAKLEASSPQQGQQANTTMHQLYQAADATHQQQRQGFRIGEVGLMIGYDEGSELTEVPPLYYLPNAPVWFMGMANLHGLVIPVVDLSRFLGVEQTISAQQMLLVLGHGVDAIGIVIVGFPQRLRWASDMQVSTDIAPRALLPYIKSACLVEEEIWFDLDVNALLSALEDGMRQT